MKNSLIKEALRKAGLTQWELARILGVGETTLSRRFRDDLPEEEQLEIVKQIEEAVRE